MHVQNNETNHVPKKRFLNLFLKRFKKERDKIFAQGRSVNPDNEDATADSREIKMQESHLNHSLKFAILYLCSMLHFQFRQ